MRRAYSLRPGEHPGAARSIWRASSPEDRWAKSARPIETSPLVPRPAAARVARSRRRVFVPIASARVAASAPFALPKTLGREHPNRLQFRAVFDAEPYRSTDAV